MHLLMIYPDTRGLGACRSCKAPIVWVEMTNGRKHPINAPLTTAEALEQHKDERGRPIWAVEAARSHFVTCPDAKQWSKKRTRAS